MTTLLTTSEAAGRLRLADVTLRRWRLEGVGPRFIKLNRAVRYTPEALDEFITGRSVTSTTEAFLMRA